MSNQVGLILSFIFLSFFLLLSGEVITYQQISVKSMSYLNDLALYIQNYGYDEIEIEKLASYSYFDKVEINIIENDDYYITYRIVGYKEYEYATRFLNYGFDDIVCNLNVTRKEF